MKTITFIYTTEFAEIAQKIESAFFSSSFIVFKYQLTIETIDLLWTNYRSSLSLSDLIVPILFPIQKSDQSYSNLRHFFSEAGAFETDHQKACLPIYIMPKDLQSDLKKELIRYPQHFFRNTFALNWSIYLEEAENLQLFKTKFAALSKLHETYEPAIDKKTINIEQCIEAISKNNLPQALTKLKECIQFIPEGKQYLKSLLLLESQFSAYQEKDINGTASSIELILEKNKITSSLLKLIALIEELF